MEWFDQLGVLGIPAVGFLGDTLKRRIIIFRLHELASKLVSLLPVSIRALKLRPVPDGTSSETFSCVSGHKKYFFLDSL